MEWEAEIAPAIKSGKRVLIVAHGNTIRGLCQHLDEISDEDITGLDIPTGGCWIGNMAFVLRSCSKRAALFHALCIKSFTRMKVSPGFLAAAGLIF